MSYVYHAMASYFNRDKYADSCDVSAEVYMCMLVCAQQKA